MPHEQLSPQFNFDDFKKEFELAFAEYLINGDKTMHMAFDIHEIYNEELESKKRELLKQAELKSFDRIAELSAQAFKNAGNKQSIVKLISFTFKNHFLTRSEIHREDPLSGIHALTRLWEKVIIRLLDK